MKNDTPFPAYLIAFALSAPLFGAASAQIDYPLNLTEAARTAIVGDVHLFQESPNGQHIVYIADQETDGIVELYSLAVAGGMPVRLNAPLVTGGNVVGFEISADSSKLVYRANQDSDSVFELYSVPIGGGPAVKISGAMGAGGSVMPRFEITPDGKRVVFLADREVDGVTELYSVPSGGGVVTKLNGTLVAGGDVASEFQISPDSSRVAYICPATLPRANRWWGLTEDQQRSCGGRSGITIITIRAFGRWQ